MVPSNGERSIRMKDEVLTIQGVAALLRLAEKAVLSMASSGELSTLEILDQWRIGHTGRRALNENVPVW